MNLTELESILENSNIPKHYYSLTGGLPSEALCIEQRNDGKWCTYYSERGLRTGLEEFETEEAACNYFYDMIRNDTDLGPLV